MTPAKGFRSGQMMYNNIMYAVAGLAAETLGGKPYSELLEELLFEPIGMDASEVFNPDAAPFDGYAKSYVPDDSGNLFAVPFRAYSG